MSIELSYIKYGNYYLPNLILDESTELRREYLKEHRLGL